MYFPFLAEAPHFGSRLLDALRTPLELGEVTIGRVQQQVTYPANFQLVMAANPCPCGKAGVAGQTCDCPPMMVRRYQNRVSGPILQRIDINHSMPNVTTVFTADGFEQPEPSSRVLQRVVAARDRQEHRLADTPWRTNSQVAGSYLRRELPLPSDMSLLERALVTGRLSLRGVDRVLRLAWTLADLAGEATVGTPQLRVAMALRHAESLGAAA